MQAKIYLTLVKFGKADVKTISKASSVTRQAAYRVMPQLEELGLAQKIIAPQTIYKATPIDEGSKLLLEKEEQKIIELQKRVMRLKKGL